MQSPVPDETLEPSSPDAVSHNMNIGFGYTIDKTVIDFLYEAGIYEDRDIDN